MFQHVAGHAAHDKFSEARMPVAAHVDQTGPAQMGLRALIVPVVKIARQRRRVIPPPSFVGRADVADPLSSLPRHRPEPRRLRPRQRIGDRVRLAVDLRGVVRMQRRGVFRVDQARADRIGCRRNDVDVKWRTMI